MLRSLLIVALLLTGCATTLAPVEVTRIVEVIVTATPEPATPIPPPADGAFDTGPARWRVLSAQDKGQTVRLGATDLTEQTEGRFIWIALRVDNLGKEPVSLEWNFAQLYDGQKRMFREFVYRNGYRDLCTFTMINPGLGTECFIVFDVAPDAADFRLSLEIDDNRAEVPLTLAP